MWLQSGRQAGGAMAWESGIRRDRLLSRGWIKSEDRLQNTGNYLQYPMTATVEKDRKKDTYIHVNLTAELTQHCEALKKFFLVKKMNKNK